MSTEGEAGEAAPIPALIARSPLEALWNRDRNGEDEYDEHGEAAGEPVLRERASGDPLHEIEIRVGENTGELAIATEHDIV